MKRVFIFIYTLCSLQSTAGKVHDKLYSINAYGAKMRLAENVGAGVNGVVNELYADDTHSKLYVGGSFSIADDSIQANNIAYVTEAGGIHTWHSLGTGVNGPVYAITEFNNNIWVAGSFSVAGGVPVNNVAYWDGVNWHDAGCIYGVVKDLIVFDSVLYASGDFDVCAVMAEVNFAEWNGAGWVQHWGLTGRVNTMEVMDTSLLLGGWFTYNSTQVNAIKWSKNTGFSTFAHTIKNEINDFEPFKGVMYSVSKQSVQGSLGLIGKLNGNVWDTLTLTWLLVNDSGSYNTLCADADSFMMGGYFSMSYVNGMLLNCADIAPLVSTPAYSDEVFVWVDSTINKMVTFKGILYLGGAFKYGNDNLGDHLNGIAYKVKNPVSVAQLHLKQESVVIYPNPATDYLQIEGINEKVRAVHITDITGRVVKQYSDVTRRLDIKNLSANALYVLHIATSDAVYIRKFRKE